MRNQRPYELAPPLRKGALAAYERWREAMRWKRALDRELQPMGLTHTQLLVLNATAVAERDDCDAEGVAQVDIALEAGIDPVTTGAVVRKLEENGLVDLDAGFDGRAVGVILTTEGARLLSAAVEIAEKVARSMESPPTPRRRIRRALWPDASG